MNPFKYGQVVGKDDFCPRPKLEKELKEYISSGQNILLLGERRIGKTSLIFEILRTLKTYKVLYIDTLEIKTIEDFCRRIINSIVSLEKKSGILEKVLQTLSDLRPSMTFDPFTGIPTFSIDASVKLKPEYIEGLMDLIFNESKTKKLVIVFDEFQDILNLKEASEALAVLRSKIQFHSKIPYVFAGSIRNKLDEIFNHPDSPFFKSTITINIDPLNPDLFKKFIIKKFHTGKRDIAEKVFIKIFEITGDIPGDIQQLCGAIWEITSYNSDIDEGIIPEALQVVFSRELKGYESYLNLLTSQQLRCLVGLAKLGGKSPFSSVFMNATGIQQPSSVQKTLNRLLKIKVIYKYNKEYKFVNPFFKSWLIFKNF